jgi:uncharacterized protein (DUF2267 family)
MTWPLEYQLASLEFERFMVAARDAAGLQTTNMAWNMVEGVLHAFRRRLTVDQALRFADCLPPVVRALFLENWHPDSSPAPFGTPEEILAEVRSVRPEHNFSPPNAVEAVARALRACIKGEALERALSTLPVGATDFWATS